MTTTTSSTSSLERALADIELLQAAFPHEIDASIRTRPTFPLHVRLVLDASSSLALEYSEGYPETTGLVVSSMRSPQKHRMEAVAQAVRTVALEYYGMEAGMACCAAALEAWKDGESTLLQESDEQVDEKVPITTTSVPTPKDYHWVTSSTPVVDRKSTFLAHYCLIESEDNVQPALQQLRQRSSKMQRATHHMVCNHDTLHSKQLFSCTPQLLLSFILSCSTLGD
jgi:hypothetical protein